jgi:hypothetical protein
MALQDAIERVQYHATQTTSIRAAPDNLDFDAANQGVYAFSYPATGSMGTEASGQGHDLHTIATEIHVTGSDIKQISIKDEGILEAFVNKLRGDTTLNATVSTIVPPITYATQVLVDQPVKQIVHVISTTVKIRPTYTVT